MKKIFSLIVLIFLSFLNAQESERGNFKNLLDLRINPGNPDDVAVNMFSDLGAWHAYAFPGESNDFGGFYGPILMGMNGQWVSSNASKLTLKVNGQEIDFSQTHPVQSYYPGIMAQMYEIKGLRILQQLIFLDNRQTLIRTQITNIQNDAKKINPGFKGSFYDNGELSKTIQNELSFSLKEENSNFRILFSGEPAIIIDGNNYTANYEEMEISGHDKISFIQIQSYRKERGLDMDFLKDGKFDAVLLLNQKRWNGYLENYLSKTKNLNSDQTSLAVKSIMTLMTNWRSAAGDLKHDGVFPSVSYQGFYGFWSWDSWKIAAGIALFEPELAKNVIRSMFDYTNTDGMVADCIYLNQTENNWRDTKPPLSAWGVWKVYEETEDQTFLTEMYPLLVKYHLWWFKNRDHDQNGLCEFGSTDGTKIAAAWESGMDNAVRFDEAEMLQNNSKAWSFNQESVDLNAYLAAEKGYLSKIAHELEKYIDVNRWNQEQKSLEFSVRNEFYDEEKEWFFDKKINSEELLTNAMGPEGWTPIWTEIASKEQVESVFEVMANSEFFNTQVPFPTLAANHPKFNPMKGYWRGPVWMDQVYFAIRGLQKYGYQPESKYLLDKFLKNADGLLENEPIHENYHPETGEGLNAKNFSWSAAHILMLLKDME